MSDAAGPSNSSGQQQAASTSRAQEVMLSIEPVHIYTQDLSDTAGSSTAPKLERERVLQDVTAEGKNVFVDPLPSAAQLSRDVKKLWAERGDFSKFSSQKLVDRLEKRRRRRRANLQDSSEEAGASSKGRIKAQGDDASSGTATKGGTITETEFVKLRDEVLGKLDLAHFNSIHAHQLLGMLIKAHKQQSAQSSLTAPGAGRASSPAPSVGAASARSGSVPRPAGASASNAPLSIFANLNPAGQQREGEFVLDPLAIALSKTSLNSAVSARRTVNPEDAEDEAGGGGDFDDDEENDPSNPEYGLNQARKELHSSNEYKAERLRDFKVSLATKRESIANAAQLLRSGADELRTCQASERERWRGLIALRNRGWGLTPGRPLLDVERFGAQAQNQDDEDDGEIEIVSEGNNGVSQKQKRKKSAKKPSDAKGASQPSTGLQGFGTPIVTSDGKLKEEGARDAWIGFGLAEAPVELKRRSIAYWADTTSMTSNASASGSTSSGNAGTAAPSTAAGTDRLVFPDRPRRRLRIKFVLWQPAEHAQSAGHLSASGDGRAKRKLDAVWNGRSRLEWSSDRTDKATRDEKPEAGAAVLLAQVLDTELQQASREATDEMVFGDVVAQARNLPPAFGVRLTPTSVRIVLTPRLDIVAELEAQGTTQDVEEARLQYSPFANIVLTFLRASPLRKWNAFAAATKEARRGDTPAKAAALRALAIAIPKRSAGPAGNAGGVGAASSSAGGGAQQGKNAGGGKGSDSITSALYKTDSVGPLLLTLHYWSFVARLHKLLHHLETSSLPPFKGNNHDSPSSSSPTPTTKTNALSTTSINPDRPVGSPAHLSGYAKIWLDSHLVCHLSFRQPSQLTAQFFALPSTTKKRPDVAINAHPLQLDLHTFAQLIARQLGALRGL
ncbi:hypothetical protein BCV70DRAFT_189588 [Testicularia cyperi]|uniref:Mediator of RNA polymerase II transcription subunit 17 n=1 Tax=Testicularia cyperi TaxID=1882483 RepID=A0A317XNM6_9BASI|nr:hypothetical protein BCV70DRAFT_189588 [Testicularia cyperi]